MKLDKPPLSRDNLKLTFDKWWPDLERRLSRARQLKQEVKVERSDRELLEEIVKLLRSQQIKNNTTEDQDYQIVGQSTEALRHRLERLYDALNREKWDFHEDAIKRQIAAVEAELELRGEEDS